MPLRLSSLVPDALDACIALDWLPAAARCRNRSSFFVSHGYLAVACLMKGKVIDDGCCASHFQLLVYLSEEASRILHGDRPNLLIRNADVFQVGDRLAIVEEYSIGIYFFLGFHEASTRY